MFTQEDSDYGVPPNSIRLVTPVQGEPKPDTLTALPLTMPKEQIKRNAVLNKTVFLQEHY